MLVKHKNSFSINELFYKNHCEATKERKKKDDYEKIAGKLQKLNTIHALHNIGDINSEALNSAERWLNDYIFAHMGYADFLDMPLPKNYIKGDIHTFNLSRGKASARISAVRKNLGDCAHMRLIMLLINEWSFSKIGETLYPNISKSSSRAKASAQCALLLEQLTSFYKTGKKDIEK